MLTKFPAKAVLVIATAVGNSIKAVNSFSVAGTKGARYHQQRTFCSTLSASSGLGFAEPEENQNRDESLARWEQMYQQGGEARQQQIFAMESASGTATKWSDDERSMTRAPVKVVTFDLDNTLWKTSETIGAANDALAAYLSTQKNENGEDLKIPRRVEKIMGDLFRADRRMYCPLVGATIPETSDDEDDNDNTLLLEQTLKSPVSLTQLRIDAMCYVLETENEFTPERALSFAQDAFEVWTQARHDAILDHLAPQVVETLNGIRSAIACSTHGGPVLLGAVTDGNSDPRKIELLAPYFDFCVNAESVGVSKPDKRVYLQAIRQAMAVRPRLFSDLLPPASLVGDGFDIHEAIDDEILEDIVGPYWCHIGDDFLKDIVAAKDMNMRTIFAVGLVKDKLLRENEDNSTEKEMDMAEFIKKISSQTVITLGIGADDYLAKSLHGEFIDAVAEDFSEIGKILVDWHTEAAGDPISSLATDSTKSPQSLDKDSSSENKDVLEVIEPDSVDDDATRLPVTPLASRNQQGDMDFIIPRAFRIVRENCSVDVPAPLRKRDERTMKDVMGMAQRDKTSGVFAFDPADVASLNDGKSVLKIQIGDADLTFSREIFSGMSVEEILSLTDENPVKLSLFIAEASSEPSFDLF